ncbi:MAG: hypothetical protein SFV17_12940 [Candidatus Obscuribacter sp.]|nr:hypothetical protein [Candidatus Melainabacteria bacterium]MDX1987586.1 hypothetical protein [Candidatus Obscuribacter sp.]
MSSVLDRDLKEARQAFDRGQYRELLIACRPRYYEIRSQAARKPDKAKVFTEELGGLVDFLLLFGRSQARLEDYEEAGAAYELVGSLLEGLPVQGKCALLNFKLKLEETVLALQSGLKSPEDAGLILEQLVKDIKAWRQSNSTATGAKVAALAEEATRLLVRSQAHLGRVKVQQSDLLSAGRELRQALGLAQKSFGKGDRSSYYPLLALALLHHKEGKYTLSQALARDAMEVILPGAENLGAGEHFHALLVEPLMIRAEALLAQGLWSKALLPARQAVYQALNTLGDEHSLYRQLLRVRGRVLKANYEFEEAVEDYKQLLQMQEADLSRTAGDGENKLSGSHLLIEPLCDLAAVLARSGANDQAEIYFERALKCLELAAQERPFENAGAKKGVGSLQEFNLQASDSACYQERALLDELSFCYLMQGKVADVLRNIPATLRSEYTCRLDRVTSIFDNYQDAGRLLQEEFDKHRPAE